MPSDELAPDLGSHQPWQTGPAPDEGDQRPKAKDDAERLPTDRIRTRTPRAH